MKEFLILVLIVLSTSAIGDEIFYLGDSHSYLTAENPADSHKRLGNILLEDFKNKNHNITYFSACGSSPAGWVNGNKTTCGFTSIINGKFFSIEKSNYPSIKTIYNKAKFQQIIINHGDNIFDWKNISNKRVASINANTVGNNLREFLKLISPISETNCTWIGPTYHIEGSYYKKSNQVVDEFYNQLETVLAGQCRIIDSRHLVDTHIPGDGLHHSNQDSQAWAQEVIKYLQ